MARGQPITSIKEHVMLTLLANGKLVETARWDGEKRRIEVSVYSNGRLCLRHWEAERERSSFGAISTGSLIIIDIAGNQSLLVTRIKEDKEIPFIL